MTQNTRTTLSTYYEYAMALLALTAVTIALLDITSVISTASSPTFAMIDLGIWLIFLADYSTRFLRAPKKLQFFKDNIPDLIAIIPFNSAFRIFRLARLSKMARFAKLLKFVRSIAFIARFSMRAKKFLKTNNFIYMLALTCAVTIIGALGIYYFELNAAGKSLGDALWWSFVTATTVGYGDISPQTTGGRITAAILMLVGIGFLGMLTGTIATYFLSGSNEDPLVLDSENGERAIALPDFTDEEHQELNRYIEFIRHKRK